MQQNTKKRKLKSFAQRNEKWGFILLAPWLVGVVLFLLYPLVQVIIYSFNDLKLDLDGIQLTFVGIENYRYLIKEHATFYQELLSTLAGIIPDAIIIVLFALFAAIILNGEYFGRTIARIIFFLPIIMATDLISVSIVTVVDAAAETSTGDSTSNMMFLANFLIHNTSFPKEIIEPILELIGGVFDTIKLSGVQTLIFLGGLQGINPSLYEVSKIEGATGYETFCKVTIPMISPMILICAIYTLTDALTRADIIDTIHTTGFNYAKYGLSSAMSVIYLVLGLIMVGVVAWLIGKKVFYSD